MTDRDQVNGTPKVSRRAIAKGAAWTLPVVSLAAAAPTASASTPSCPQCFKVGAIPTPVVSDAVILGGKATVFPFVITLNVDSTGCGVTLFKPAYTAVITKATLGFSDGTSRDSNVGLGTGAGTLGTISAFAGAFDFGGTPIPNGTGFLGAYQSGQKHPTSLTVAFDFILIGLPGLITITCPQVLTWSLTSVGVGAVVAGTGNVTFTSAAHV